MIYSEKPFTTNSVREIRKKKWGYEIVMTKPNSDRVGKILLIEASNRLSFQAHPEKEETLCLVSGSAMIWVENKRGIIEKKHMSLFRGYTIAMAQKHRICAISNAVVFEVSSPEKGITHRIEDDYGRGDEAENHEHELIPKLTQEDYRRLRSVWGLDLHG